MQDQIRKAKAGLSGGVDVGSDTEWVTVRRDARDAALAVIEELASELSDTYDILIAAEDRSYEHTSNLTFEVGELSEQLKDLKPDADRYRWLSDNDFLGADENLKTKVLSILLAEPTGIKFEEGDWTQQQLDAAIDAAIFAQNKKNHGD